MKSSDVINGIVVFFNDLIGGVVPGLILLTGLYWLGAIPSDIKNSKFLMETPFNWLVTLTFSYAAGHGLLGIHRLLQPIVGKVLRGFRNLVFSHKWDTSDFTKKIVEGMAYQQFQLDIAGRHKSSLPESSGSKLSELGFDDLRSVAMTISQEGGELARRFMFISEPPRISQTPN